MIDSCIQTGGGHSPSTLTSGGAQAPLPPISLHAPAMPPISLHAPAPYISACPCPLYLCYISAISLPLPPLYLCYISAPAPLYLCYISAPAPPISLLLSAPADRSNAT